MYKTLDQVIKERLDKELAERDKKDDEIIQAAADAVLMEQTVNMLKMLAKHLSVNTKLLPVPNGTFNYVVSCIDTGLPRQNGVVFYDNINIPLIKFFGIFLGYSIKLDLLVYWK